MKRKAATILLTILLTLSMYELITTLPIAKAKTWTVDDDGPADFTKIQAAINAATSGDTILVAPGTYPEYVCVNKSVRLQGTNRQSIITGAAKPSRVVDVQVSNVKMSGFKVQGPKLYYQGIWVAPLSSGIYLTNITITDNTVVGCNHGIFLSCTSKCYATSNTLQGNTYGIRLYDSTYDLVAKNFVNASSYYGINSYGRARRNEITENTVVNGVYGVFLEYANQTTMYLNTIEKNTEYALRLSYTFYSLIKGNTMKNNKYGVYIWNCSQNQFYYNNFITNTIQQEHYAVPATNKSNTWDTNTPPPSRAKGNYWSDYTGLDNGVGVGRWGEPRYASDGVGDTLIPHQGLDTYPLMFPWTPIPPGPAPVAIFTWSPSEPIVNLPATFNASKSYDINGSIVAYTWNFGDGNTTTRINSIIIHNFTAPGNYNVTLTVKDNDDLTGSTWHIVKVLPYKLMIDVFTQHPEPYSGRGPNMPSDAFAPQSNVTLYAEVTYNYEPAENKEVGFVVTDPNGTQVIIRSDNTNASGIASVWFRLATNATFGLYTVFAQVTVSGHKANDTLTFLMGWIIEIISVKTVDQYGAPKNIFSKGEQIYFSIDVKNIAFTSRNATVTVGLSDERNQLIGAAELSLTVPPGTHEYNLVFSVTIPAWIFIGTAEAHVNAYTISGVPYCDEMSATFIII